MLALMDLSKMCRVCRDESDCLLDLFLDSISPNKEQEPCLASMLSKCSGCRVDRSDGFPQFVCAECAIATRAAFRLRQQCRNSMQYFSQLRGMVGEPDSMEEPDSGDLGPSQETANTMGLVEAGEEPSHGDESNLELLYVELVATSQCLESPKKQKKLPDFGDDRLSESIAVDSSSRSSSDDSWSPLLNQKATAKTPTLKWDRSRSESSNDDASKSPKKKKVKKYQCTHCTRSFPQKGNLKAHIRVHTGERPFKCTYCTQTFKQHGHLVVHIRLHTGEKPFKCSYCSYSCHQSINLKNHIKTMHTGH